VLSRGLLGTRRPDSCTFGSCSLGDTSHVVREIGVPRLAKRMVRYFVAGPTADCRFGGRGDWAAQSRRRLRGSDAWSADRVATIAAESHCGCPHRQAGGEDTTKRHVNCTRQYIKRAAREVAKLLDDHWHQVEGVAIELARRRELRGEDLDRLIPGVPSIGLYGELN
jgi:hypothetical protein